MIGHLKGIIIYKNPPEILLQANGVGYEVMLPLTCLGEVGDIGTELELYIHTLVREDVLQLYGFSTLEKRSLFRELIKVNGIGAKMGITILSSMNVLEFYHCVNNKDSIALTKLPGVGKKTAERLLLDMYDRLKNLNISTSDYASSNGGMPRVNELSSLQQATSALVSLGYKNSEAEKLIAALPNKELPVTELIREALKLVK